MPDAVAITPAISASGTPDRVSLSTIGSDDLFWHRIAVEEERGREGGRNGQTADEAGAGRIRRAPAAACGAAPAAGGIRLADRHGVHSFVRGTFASHLVRSFGA